MPTGPRSLIASSLRGIQRAGDELYAARVCARAGLIRADSPRQLAQIALALRNWGAFGAAVAIAAIRHGDRVGVVDELGSLTFAEMDRRANALANAWHARGLRAGDGVAVLARNHRGLLDAAFACSKLGARLVLLNTDFAGPQIRDVAAREGTQLLVHDDEYGPFVSEVRAPHGRWRAWTDEAGEDTLEALIASGDPSPPPKPAQAGSVVILTSGTTGTPKGAQREQPSSLMPFAGLLDSVPFRSREATVICAPLFHALGFAHAVLAVGLGSTQILRRRFDPEAALDDVERHRASALIVVPIMLRRIVDVAEAAPGARSLSSLRIGFVAGSQLGGALATRAQDALGEVVYNLYGSTEVSYATIASPADLRASPDSVGPIVFGSRVRILDEAGRPLPQGRTGRVFVGSSMPFEGYTGGGSKETVDGLMSSGDVGHFDAVGRLFIDGRDDDMIVSGGENVFPAEIEELLASHDAVDEAAVVGVDDEQFGQRLRAYVVCRPGASLSDDAVRAYVRENLARYKVPRDVVFIDELPRNPTGKVLKRELAGLG